MISEVELLLRGVLLGLAVAMPVGPIGVLCIQRSLAGGFWAGFSGGIGTAVADAVYAALAAAGFAVLADTVGPVEGWLRWSGAAFIGWLGWRTMMALPADAAAGVPMNGRPLRLFFATFMLTISNPTTILSFAALFAGIGLGQDASPQAAAAVVAGVFAGSLLWWAVLSGFLAALRHRIGGESKRWINRVAGLFLIGFAVALVV